MKAIRIHETGSFDVLRFEEVETPSPGTGEVLIKIVTASVNFADVMLRKGTYPFMPPFPAIPGLECSGIVQSVGDGVTHLRPGQHVIFFGQQCYAEYVTAEAGAVTAIPEDLDLDDAAALTVNYATAYHLLHTMAEVKEGQTILTYAAAGGVGTAIAQLAKLAGVKVIGLTSRDEKAEYARTQGMDCVINHKTEDVTEKIMEFTGGKGVNAVLNSIAGDTFQRDLEVLAPFGNIVWFGMAAGPPERNLSEQLAVHFGKSVGIKTFVIYSIAESSRERMARTMDRLFTYLAEKKIRPHIDRRVPLSDAAVAHELIETGSVMGKLLLKP
jgi:NADPH2:quinone reductase